MVDSAPQDIKFTVQFISFRVDDGHADYLIKVLGPLGISFHIRDRYSRMASFNSDLRRGVQNAGTLPPFPAKKYFGNTAQQFLRQRQGQLETFFNNFLAHPEVRNKKELFIYFMDRAIDKTAEEAIQKIILFLAGKLGN
jgi:hypothetical protein